MRGFSHSLLLALIAISPSAFAALGGNVESVTNSNNQAVVRAQVRTIPSNGYTVHESVTEAGVTVREYASQQGVVFAVTWSGPSMPDLQQFLGGYFPQFHAAMAERRQRGVRGPVMLQQNDLVVESRGHMREFSGRAYAPNLLPPQVSIEEIQ
ncbi:MAG: DUF2844 domain-containing protein [Spongiibacteraceae bacterium]